MALRIEEQPTKYAAQQAVKAVLLDACDPDIQRLFGPHNFTLEPLLLQLLREMRRWRGGADHAAHDAAPDESV